MDPIALIGTIAALAVLLLVALLIARRQAGDAKATHAALTETSEARARAEASLAATQTALAAQQAEVAALRGKLEDANAHINELGRRLGEEAGQNAERTRMLQQAAQSLTAMRDEAEKHRAAAETLRAQLATLGETLAQERQQNEQKLALLRDVGEDMRAKFKTIADAVIAQHGEALAKKNLEQLDTTLTPLRLKLVEFQQNLQTAHADSEKERARLGEQIKALNETSVRMSSETHNLTQALKGKSQTQGAWGEMILASILEKSGLRKGEEYTAQASQTTEDGDKLRPDVIVSLPGEQRIVIDAKVSLTAYEASISAESEEERAAQLAAHARSVRQHIRTLAEKDYQKHTPGTLDYVVMFMPIEGALAAALAADAKLVEYAIENNVFVATPTTLMIALRTAANVWNVERRNRNAEAIAERAGNIYDKLLGFIDSMGDVDKALSNARRNYDKAMGQLTHGRGNVVRQLEQLKAMGAKTTKSLPQALLDESETTAEEA